MRKKVYFNEYNVLMDNAVYLPIVSGKLQAFAEKDRGIKNSHEFMPFVYHRDKPSEIISKYENPDVVAFSVSMWNSNLSLEVAKGIKER